MIVLLISGLAIGLTAYFHNRRSMNPLLPLKLFRSRRFNASTLITFLIWGGLAIVLFYLPMVLIVGWKLPEYYAAGVFMPFSVMVGLVSSWAGRLSDRYGARNLIVVGSLIMAGSQLFMIKALWDHEFWWGLVPATAIMGLGLGMVAPSVTSVVMSSAGDEHSGIASGVNNMVARMASLMAVAAMGALASVIHRSMVTGANFHPQVQDLMQEAGFGERLTGALYQINTIKLQELIMDDAMAVLCLVIMALCIGTAVVCAVAIPNKTENEV